MKLSAFDVAKLNAMFSPAAMRSLNEFLEQLPQRLGLNILILAAIVWGGVAVLVFYTSLQAKSLTELRAELVKADSMKPAVPTLDSVPVTRDELDAYVKKMQLQLPGLTFSTDGSGITISAGNTAAFGRFRDAVLQSFNSGKNWRLNIKSMCVGRECIDKGEALHGTFNVTRYSVTPPSN